tara:strand:+ start:1487 stop:1879 length:393 start_codon:yes stop_codon:yes gene_type:complete
MAIIYNWDIPQMNAHIQAEGEDNVIYTVHWRYTGTEFVPDGAGNEPPTGKTFSSTLIGTQGYTYLAGDPFVPYENTEAFETIVIGWLEGSLDVTQLQVSLAANIAAEIAPLNEDLYFTWNNPVPPVPPVK